MPAPAHRSIAAAALIAALAAEAGLAAPQASDPQPTSSADLSPRALCGELAKPVALGSAQWNGWGRGVENTRYQPEPAIRATDVPKLALKWAFGYSGAAAAGQPTIVDGRVFAASSSGRVYALDTKSGCLYWTFDAAAGVRTAISVGELATPRMPAPPKATRQRGRHQLTNAHLEMPRVPGAVFFGDDRGAVYALDAAKGTLLWKTAVDVHPSARIEASPTLYKDRLYVAVGSNESDAAKEGTYACCTFRGSVAALEIASGRIVWRTFMVPDEPRPSPGEGGTPRFGPAGVPILGAPTIDTARSLVYVATGDSNNPGSQPLADAMVALDLEDGKVRWAKQLLVPAGGSGEFWSPAVLRALVNGKQSILVGQRSGIVYSLDPDRGGEILWQTQASDGKSAGAGFGAAADHRSLFVPLSGLDADPSGSLVAIDIKTGAKRWLTESPTPACSWGGAAEACSHAETQAVTVIPGAAFSGSLDGHLRAYSTIDGRILWDYDTAKDFITVNHVKGAGGSLDRGGPTIVNGLIFVNSGGIERGQPGNVLLAFSVDGK